MGATMERIAVGDIELEFDDQGSGEPVVFIHGSGPADSFLPMAIDPAVPSDPLPPARSRMVTPRRSAKGSTHVAEGADGWI